MNHKRLCKKHLASTRISIVSLEFPILNISSITWSNIRVFFTENCLLYRNDTVVDSSECEANTKQAEPQHCQNLNKTHLQSKMGDNSLRNHLYERPLPNYNSHFIHYLDENIYCSSINQALCLHTTEECQVSKTFRVQ